MAIQVQWYGSDIKRLKELEEESLRLKQMYADLSLKAQMWEDIIKKLQPPALDRKVWAQELQAQYGVSILVSCQVVCISRTAYYYKPKLSDNIEIIDVLNELTDKHNRWVGVPNALGYTWTMVFVSDRLHNNIRFRTFNVIDNYNWEVLGIEVGTSMPSLRVIRYLDQLAEWLSYPKQILVDNAVS